MPQKFDVCIRGAGIVGHTLALLLARERLRVALVAPPTAKPSNAADGDVRAYALNTASRQVLESLRTWPDEVHATPITQMQVWGDQGASVCFDAAEQGVSALTWIVDVPALEQRLAEAVRYQPQVEWVSAPVPAALTAICEGRASRTRAEWGVEFDVTPYPQHAIATRIACERPHGQVARQWFSQGTILAFLPLGGAEGNSAAVVWSVPPEQVPGLLALDDDAFAQCLQAALHQARYHARCAAHCQAIGGGFAIQAQVFHADVFVLLAGDGEQHAWCCCWLYKNRVHVFAINLL